MRRCCGCGEHKPLTEFYGKNYRCKPCFNAKQRAWRAENPTRVRSYQKKWDDNNREARKTARLKRLYGMTQDQFDALLERQDGCAICHTQTPGGRGTWHVDHDHSCCPGEKSCGSCVRGLLCSSCNQGIGLFRDDPSIIESALRYLERAELG